MTEGRTTRFSYLIPCGMLLIAAFLIYLPSELGMSLLIAPDASEYSICLANLFEHGRFGFTLNGEWYPSRYAPWFSLLCLTPAYLLSGGDVLCLHWAILVFALVLLFVVWKIGAVCGLGKMAILPPVLLMFMPDFLFYSRVVMTEIPYATLFVILTFVFVRFVDLSHPSPKLCVGIGFLVAWTGLVRFTGFALIIPFVVVVFARHAGWKFKVGRVLLMALPIIVALVAGLAYNWYVFGSPSRSGYNYWSAFPFDFRKVTFNWHYVLPAISSLFGNLIIPITVVFMTVPLVVASLDLRNANVAKNRRFLLVVVFVMVHAVVLLGLYLGYYWTDTRFFLPLTVISTVMFFVAVNDVVSRCFSRQRALLVAILFAGSVFAVVRAECRYVPLTRGRPIWFVESQMSAEILPRQSIVLQKGDPSLMDYFGFKDKRIILYPLDRGFDYLANMVAPRQITNLWRPQEQWHGYIISELIDSGICRLPFPSTFEEDPNQIVLFLDEGKRVFYQRDYFCSKASFECFRTKMQEMGLELRRHGVWSVPAVSPNFIKRSYDKILFHDDTMNRRPEVVATFYEIVKAERLR